MSVTVTVTGTGTGTGTGGFTSFEGARLPIGVRVLAGHAELGVALLVARSPRGAVGLRLLVLDVGLARGRGVGLREVRLVAASTVAKRECAARSAVTPFFVCIIV